MVKYTVVAAMLLMAACSGTKSYSVQSLKATDKQLACQDILLEINEAQFYQQQAERNRGLSFGNVLKPWTYPSTFFSSEKAVGSVQERISYLENVSRIKNCNGENTTVAAAPQPTPQPQPTAPVYQPSAYPYPAPVMVPVMPQQPVVMPGYQPTSWMTPMSATAPLTY